MSFHVIFLKAPKKIKKEKEAMKRMSNWMRKFFDFVLVKTKKIFFFWQNKKQSFDVNDVIYFRNSYGVPGIGRIVKRYFKKGTYIVEEKPSGSYSLLKKNQISHKEKDF